MTVMFLNSKRYYANHRVFLCIYILLLTNALMAQQANIGLESHGNTIKDTKEEYKVGLICNITDSMISYLISAYYSVFEQGGESSVLNSLISFSKCWCGKEASPRSWDLHAQKEHLLKGNFLFEYEFSAVRSSTDFRVIFQLIPPEVLPVKGGQNIAILAVKDILTHIHLSIIEIKNKRQVPLRMDWPNFISSTDKTILADKIILQKHKKYKVTMVFPPELVEILAQHNYIKAKTYFVRPACPMYL